MASCSQIVFNNSRLLRTLSEFVDVQDLNYFKLVNKAFHRTIVDSSDTNQRAIAYQRAYEPASSPPSFTLAARMLTGNHFCFSAALKLFDFLSVRDLARYQGVDRYNREVSKKTTKERILASLSLPVVEKSLRELLGEPKAVLNQPQPRPLSERSTVSQVIGNSYLRSAIVDFLPTIDQYSCKGVSHSFLHDVESVQERRISRELTPELEKRCGKERLKEARIVETCMLLPTRPGEALGELEQTGLVSYQRGKFTIVVHAKIFYSQRSSFAICQLELHSIKRLRRDLLV